LKEKIEELNMSEIPYKQRTEKSLEWIIGLESLIFGIVCGYYASNSGASSAMSVGLAIGVMILMYVLIVNIKPFFWIWTLCIAAVIGSYMHQMLTDTDTDKGWALLWAAITALIVIGLHVKSWTHINAPTITNIKNR
jgi:xanthine/uracil permease